MKKFLLFYLQTACLCLLSLTGISIHPFVSYYLLKNQEGHTILLLGDRHFEEQLKKLNKTHIDTFISSALARKGKPLPCLVELGQLASSLFSTNELPDYVNVGDTFKYLAELYHKHKGKLKDKIDFICADSRGNESDEITGLALIIEAICRNEIPCPSASAWEQIKERATAASHTKLSLFFYFEIVEKNLITIQNIRDSFSPDTSLYTLFDSFARNFAQAKATAAAYFTHMAPETGLERALLSLFDTCREPIDFLKKYNEIAPIFYEALDWRYADACFLHTLLNVSSKEPYTVLMIAGYSHTEKLSDMLQKLGYTVVKEETTIKDLGDGFCDFSVASAENLTHNLRAIFHKIIVEEPACNLCFKTDKLSKCGRCKVVQYCSKECQQKDWAIHKHQCKPTNT
jgi:hypothetical protein